MSYILTKIFFVNLNIESGPNISNSLIKKA